VPLPTDWGIGALVLIDLKETSDYKTKKQTTDKKDKNQLMPLG
jgi:hypothetical protein